MIDHSGHDHPATPAGRSKCRRANGAPTKKAGAKVRVLDLTEDEKRPADKSRCCYNCGVRQIEWRGTVPIENMLIYTCEKCKYLIKNSPDLQAMEV